MTQSAARSTALIGLQFGDEGKGQMADRLSASHDVIVRYNGGANAGHTITIGDQRFALHQIPIGVLTPDRLNVLANGVVLDVERFAAELATLSAQGIDAVGRLRISDRAHLVMPYHRAEEKLRDLLASRLLDDDARLGTTARGIGPAYADRAARDTAIRVADVFEPDVLGRRLCFIAEVKDAVLGALAARAGVAHEPVEADQLAALCAGWAEQLRPFICDTGELLRDAVSAGRRLLFEGANAALLDVDHGIFPYVTSSNSSVCGISAGTGLPPSAIGDVVGVAKLYVSKVGTGPFPTEIHGADAEDLRQRGNEYGTTTGRPRRVGWLDLPALRVAVQLNGVTKLVLTGLGVLSGLPSIRVCTGYRAAGRILSCLPASAEGMRAIEPVYEELAGLSADIGACEAVDDLPREATALLDLVEQHVAPIAYVCVGRRRDQVIRYAARD